eukprot:2055688-Rhodomonas_salina.1
MRCPVLPTRLLCVVRYGLRACCAFSGTAYAPAMRRPVLTSGVRYYQVMSFAAYTDAQVRTILSERSAGSLFPLSICCYSSHFAAIYVTLLPFMVSFSAVAMCTADVCFKLDTRVFTLAV